MDREKICKVLRNLVRVMCAAFLLYLCVVVFLAAHGVPGPILRKIEQQAGAQGLSIEIESIHLTVHGWRAQNVRIYSSCPDDLEPVFIASTVYLKRTKSSGDDREKKGGIAIGINARDITLSPSVQWCVGLETESSLRHVDQIKAFVALSPDQINLRDGFFLWRGIQFNINGVVLTGPGTAKPEEAPARPAYLPYVVSHSLQESFEHTLNALQLSESAVVDLDFLFDVGDPASSQAALSARIDSVDFRDVSFSHASIDLSYDHQLFRLNQASVERDNGAFSLSGEYGVDSKDLWLRVSNTISSSRMFLLMPQAIMDWMVAAGFRPESFPEVDLHFGPSSPHDLLQKISGTFAVQDMTFRDWNVAALQGSVERIGSRLDVHDLQGKVRGQQSGAADAESCMAGGALSGVAFWDSTSGEFGFSTESEFDPHLLLGPLSGVRTATNVISRFRFADKPPRVWFELKACYHDWDSLMINVRAVTDDMQLHGVPFSSLTGSAAYRNGVLSLDPIVAQQGIDYLKGSVVLDFNDGMASFDATGSVNPKTIEGVVYPGSVIFSQSILVSGPTKINARGIVDWRSMQKTEFIADVEAEKMRLPIAVLDRFTATVSGDGPVVAVNDAAFKVFGGEGKGSFSVHLESSTNVIPYRLDLKVKNSDFQRFLKYITPEASHRSTGDLSGELMVEADFSSTFFESAKGSGRINIRHGQLADLPLFKGLSNAMRKVIPSFRFFSINSLSGDFTLRDGKVYSDNAYFDGDVLSAKGRGSYDRSTGFDAYVQAQILSDNSMFKLFRFFTDPIFKFFELKLEGTLESPEWKLDTFSSNGDSHPSKE